jgi:hypothetical protein
LTSDLKLLERARAIKQGGTGSASSALRLVGCEASIRMHSAVFEDNNGAHQLAATQRLSTRTRCFSAESHFFWQAVRDRAPQLARVSTHGALADAMSKGLLRTFFEKLCKKLMGWWAIA